MSFTTRSLSTRRLVIYDLLKRTREYHFPTLGIFEWDITDTQAHIEALRDRGVMVNLASLMVKATATVMRDNERLRTRMFHGVRGPFEATFDEVSCNLVILRDTDKGPLLFPAVLRHVDELDIVAIAAKIRSLKTDPLDQLDEAQQMRKLKNVPRVLTRLHDFKVRSDPKYFIERFGTYGMSTTTHEESGLVGGVALGPGTTFYPSRIGPRPHVVDGELAVRTMVLFGVCVDHQISDGMEQIAVGKQLKRLIEEPEHLLGHL
ncbi:MAG: hypothetical protein EP330_26535 [Deltaproteobacteria bacterium]|nr:MAG: hypothetical protein EP330_26535 [Deltaproteobacteria bacterium]